MQESNHLADLLNERALAHFAMMEPDGFATLGVGADDFEHPVYARVVRLAGTLPLAQMERHRRLSALLQAGRDSADPLTHIPVGDGDFIVDTLLDPPLGVIADAEKLRRMRARRDLREALQRGLVAVDCGDDQRALDLVRCASERITEAPDGVAPVLSLLQALTVWLEEVMRREREKTGISPGLPRLQEEIGFLAPGNVLVIGGGTNVGKSTFALEMCLHAVEADTRCGLISMEDTNFTTATRLVSVASGISSRALHRGDRLAEATPAVERMAQLGERLLICEAIGKNEADVCTRMSVMAKRGARLIVVDYIGEVGASIPQQDRRNEIRWIMKRLKAHAISLGVALVIVSQLARPKDGNANTEPSKHNLKEAGDLENSADFIVLLWRKEESDFAPVNVKLAKSKHGGVGTFWQMQRELQAVDAHGDPAPGGARFREVQTPDGGFDRPRMN